MVRPSHDIGESTEEIYAERTVRLPPAGWHQLEERLDELNRLRQVLRKADIDVLLIRVGD